MPRYHFGSGEWMTHRHQRAPLVRRENEPRPHGPRVLTLLQREQMGEAFVAWCAGGCGAKVDRAGNVCVGCAAGDAA